MIKDQDLEHWVRSELRSILPNCIWRNDDGEYELFGKYRIVPNRPGYTVYCAANAVGNFSSTKTAVSWCVADKYRAYNLAREIHTTDTRLTAIANDMFVRAGVANRSKRADFRESVDTKLETKIIRRKALENQLTKCVDLAKYLQQKGFDNETARSGRATKNQTSR
ncbi:hypothetical protein UFOVP328_335 [uncultured Caudovirales phage]|uniref:Uncharacterized protein n=1 Tax=uncultured Caudovirales phage TaxID=2100421 RepID=A0A6J5LWD7_9CAUD|nr:hypothetical protein UFOVP328_335 [uncultured Caudovirales phage]